MSDHDIEGLCTGYRKYVENPPYDAVDAAVLHAALRQTRRPKMRRLTYGIVAALLVALGLAADVRTLVVRHRPVNVATTKVHEAPSIDYLSNAMLTSGSARAHDLWQTSAFLATQPGPTCATAAADDLNAPGALDLLRVSKPGDYARIMRIIAGVTRHPELDVARWISATFHAGNVSYLPLWQTSLPPKRRLSFCLAGTGYSVVLTITRDGARVSPTLSAAHPP
ncbi:MAG TPA: hypothetical protein VIY50_02575 [Steroidobacteraceae bacterium]